MVCPVIVNDIKRRFELIMMPALFALFFIPVVLGDKPPEITLRPNSQRVRDAGSVSFYCAALGDPSPTIYWKKNGLRISENLSRYHTKNFTGNKGLSVLRIDSTRAMRDNASTYECVAENRVGNARAEATLIVFEDQKLPPGFPVITSSLVSKAADVGHTVLLNCAAHGDPTPTITWIRDQFPLDINNNERYSVLVNGSQVALQIKNAMENDAGNYECVAENSVGSEYSEPVSLYVGARYAAPHFSIAPPSYKEVKLGEDVNITCAAIGSPLPDVTWIKEPSTIISNGGHLLKGENVLQIKNVQTSENYTCIASNLLGMVDGTTYVKVQSPETMAEIAQIKPLNSSAMVIQGNKSESTNEQATAYKVYYTTNPDSPLSSWHSQFVDNTLFTTISQLTPSTAYTIRVQAFTSVGPPSAPVQIKTHQQEVPGQPTEVKASPVNSTTIFVEWKP